LDKSGVVAISYGATRKFRIRDKITKEIVVDIPTLSNNIMHMGGDFQKEFTHEIPIEKTVKDARYSFTFRNHNK
jgi:alkylated DNA repair dioxygenase AlkB